MNIRRDPPDCEIVTIGTELLLGQINDTNSTFIARELNRAGIAVSFRTAVGDRLEEIESVIRKASKRCDMVITTGGLGPTLDDLTREAVAEAAGVELEFKEELMAQIEEFFRLAGFHMTENNRRQAFIPAGGKVIQNPVGTAPGFIAEVNNKPVICLPGVPRELTYLLDREVIPWLHERFGLESNLITYRVLKTAGVGESTVDSMIGDLIIPGHNPEVGLLASAGEIKIRITAKADDEKGAMSLIAPVEEEIRSRLGEKIFGEDEDTLEGVINSLLAEKSLTLAVLETFSAGLMAGRLHKLKSSRLITSLVLPGEKDVARWLGVESLDLEQGGIQSLADRIREMGGADLGLAAAGFPEKRGDRYVLKGYSHVTGKGIEKTFSWQSAGELPVLRLRSSVTGLNTLRLALIEGGS